MTTKTNKKVDEQDKELCILDERVLTYDEDLHPSSSRETHTVHFDRDSYIVLFEGRRGGGKTTAMTFFIARAVAIYNMKVYSNYPLEFMIRRHRKDGKSYLQHVKAENLDFERMMVFDDEYQNCLIAIDEAPDIISHMASQSWKNRLVAAFTRQLRKNRNTLFLASQDFELIDKSMRWQVDLIIQCKDAARAVGDNAGVDPGEVIWLKLFDQSGQWTGETSEDRRRKGEDPCVMYCEIFPRFMWGDDTHKAVYDSWYQIDILDSLRKVDLRLSSIKITGNGSDGDAIKYPVSVKVLYTALNTIEKLLEARPDNPTMYQKEYFNMLDAISDQDKNNLGKLLSSFNVERGTDGSNNKRYYSFDNFELESFRGHIQKISTEVIDKS